MPVVSDEVTIQNVLPSRVWDVLCDFSAFPRTMADVVAVDCMPRAGDRMRSSWRVLLNGSELTWTEDEEFIDGHEIRFNQVEGDLEVWKGTWLITPVGDDVLVSLNVEFDLGIPSLAEMLNPIGIRAIRANSRQMLQAISSNSRLDAA